MLTFARIWATVATGTIWSKDRAADWALARLPEEHRSVLVRARAIYTGEEDPDERWDDLQAAIRPHVDAVLAEIEQARGAGLPSEGARVARRTAVDTPEQPLIRFTTQR